jgi:DNA-binding transcriptional MerR regulator
MNDHGRSLNPGVNSKVKPFFGRKNMRIGQLAKRTGVSPDTLRFYERLDLLDGHRRDNGYRDYPDSAVDRIEFIKLAQELGFTLAEIRSIAPMLAGGALPVEQVQAFIHDKLALIDQRIATLQTLRDRLANLPLGEACPMRL